jgi:hypothetical protein
MFASPAGPRKPRGSRPAPSHSSSSSSSGAQSISGARSAVPYSEHGGVYEPSTSSEDFSSLSNSFGNLEIAHPVAKSASNSSLNAPQKPLSRSTTPKPKLASLMTGGGVAASIGAPDPDTFDAADVPALPPLRPTGPPISLQMQMPMRAAPMPPNEEPSQLDLGAPRPSLRPPPIGGGSKKRGPLLAIPLGSTPTAAIGADEPDALDLIPNEESGPYGSQSRSNGTQPLTPLNLGGDDGDVNVRPALPQGHSQAKSIDKIKAALSPGPSTASSGSSIDVSEEDWAEADEFLVDVQRLGEGAGGEVYKVEDKRTGTKLARKIIQARTTPPKQLVRELKYLKDTGHANIVKFYGAYISPSSSEVKVLMEFCEGGSLEAIGEKIKQGKGRVSEPVAAKIGEGVSALPFVVIISDGSLITIFSDLQRAQLSTLEAYHSS